MKVISIWLSKKLKLYQNIHHLPALPNLMRQSLLFYVLPEHFRVRTGIFFSPGYLEHNWRSFFLRTETKLILRGVETPILKVYIKTTPLVLKRSRSGIWSAARLAETPALKGAHAAREPGPALSLPPGLAVFPPPDPAGPALYRKWLSRGTEPAPIVLPVTGSACGGEVKVTMEVEPHAFRKRLSGAEAASWAVAGVVRAPRKPGSLDQPGRPWERRAKQSFDHRKARSLPPSGVGAHLPFVFVPRGCLLLG